MLYQIRMGKLRNTSQPFGDFKEIVCGIVYGVKAEFERIWNEKYQDARAVDG